MAKLLARSFALLALAAVIVGPAFAGKGLTRKEKDEAIKALEGKIHQLQGQEKGALKSIDERYNQIIRSMDPKGIHHQLEEILVVLHQVNDLLSVYGNGTPDKLNYDDNRAHAHESIVRAEHQMEKALHHDTWEERAHAAHDIGAVHEDLLKALAFSAEHPLKIDGKSKEDLERRAVENQHLTEALPKIEVAHYVLAAADHEITDYKEEKNVLNQKRGNEKNDAKEQIGAQIKELQEQIKVLKK
jgi:DNA repair exonuclease SbcCD ATPase subunit